MNLAALAACAYLLGSIPFSWIVVKWVRGVDLREVGSGNPGATNASRAFPRKWRFPAFLALFVLDAGKGYLAAGLLPPRLYAASPGPAVAAACAVFGHTFTPFLRFRGGKGVATTCGAFLALDPVSTLIAVGVFLAVMAVCRIVALGSLAMAVALPVAVFLRGAAPLSVGILACVLAVLIFVRHKSNIVQLLHGKAAS